ncbi:MAG: sugar transferase [Lentisphaeria bacterium]|jgi:lipopolysaccharide/colanic/teichoic acid biosynthesis glycosyltransferase
MKRLFDIVTSFLGLVALSPLLLLTALAIVAADGVPLLFRQLRVGRHGRDFRLCKFRTMAVRKEAEMGSFDAGGAARVTPLGRFLRKTKLDELPQLWNVLIGDMSLVGPRPEVRKWVDAYPERWAAVLTVRPGITDNASIEFRNEEEILARAADPEKAYREDVLPRKLDLYEAYVQNHNLVGDLKILFRTLWTIVRR